MSLANDDMVRTLNPGFLAPADGNAAGGASAVPYNGISEQRLDLGPNNERLEDAKPEVVHALRELVRQYRQEGVVARRHEIRRIRQARLFWQGLQYAWWNPNDMNWHLPYENRSSDDRELEEMPRYQFVTNFYQGFGLSFIAVLSQDVPSVRFYPQSPQSLEDIAAARVASDVAQLVEQNNHVEQLLTTIGYFLWTDGKLGAYVRYVADGQRFGFHEENLLEALEIPLGEDLYVCPECGKETPVTRDPWSVSGENTDEGQPSGFSSTDHGTRDTDHASDTSHESRITSHASCPGCGAELTDANLRKAERVTVPRIIGTQRVPNGQEVISIAGGLELNTPVWANEMHEYPYLQWQSEVHRAKLKAAYPHVANKIESAPSQGSEDVYARVSRLSVEQGLPSIHPGDALSASRPTACCRIFSTGTGAGAAGHDSPSAGFDRSCRAISDRSVSRDFWRKHGRCENRFGLCAGARSGHGPPRARLAANETILCRCFAARRGLLPQKPAGKRGDSAARARWRARCAFHPHSRLERQHLRPSGSGRNVSALEVATARACCSSFSRSTIPCCSVR
jgi:hypothetical protein